MSSSDSKHIIFQPDKPRTKKPSVVDAEILFEEMLRNSSGGEQVVISTVEPDKRMLAKLRKFPDLYMEKYAHSDAISARHKAIAHGAILPCWDLTQRLGITRQALNKAVHDNRIFLVEVGGINYYPAFYADPALERRDAEKVTKALGNLLGWQKWQFFTTRKASLGGLTPLEALKKAQVVKVVTAAHGFADR